jgi:hypothetical protein
MNNFGYEITEASTTIASGVGNAKTVAAALRSIADQIDPPTPDAWAKKGQEFGDKLMAEMFGGSWAAQASRPREGRS